MTTYIPGAKEKTVTTAQKREMPRQTPVVQRKEKGNDAEKLSRLVKSAQPRPQIGKPDDPREKEADSMIHQVMRKPESNTAPFSSAASSGKSTDTGGQPLPESVRTFMEPRFGADFSEVRVHDDAQAHLSARAVQARAFTQQQHIYYGEGEAPVRDALTAHELAHTLQQAGGQKPAADRIYRKPATVHLITENFVTPRQLEAGGYRCTDRGWPQHWVNSQTGDEVWLIRQAGKTGPGEPEPDRGGEKANNPRDPFGDVTDEDSAALQEAKEAYARYDVAMDRFAHTRDRLHELRTAGQGHTSEYDQLLSELAQTDQEIKEASTAFKNAYDAWKLELELIQDTDDLTALEALKSVAVDNDEETASGLRQQTMQDMKDNRDPASPENAPADEPKKDENENSPDQ